MARPVIIWRYFPRYVVVGKAVEPTGLNLETAKRNGTCRVCGKPIMLTVDLKYPQRYDKMCGSTVGEGEHSVTLNNGEEFAHTACLFSDKPIVGSASGKLK